jgi:hypothetical protein
MEKIPKYTVKDPETALIEKERDEVEYYRLKELKRALKANKLVYEHVYENPERFVKQLIDIFSTRDIRSKYDELARLALVGMANLAIHAKSEKTRLEAQKFVASMAGHGPVTKSINIGATVDPKELSDSDAIGVAKGLLRQIEDLGSRERPRPNSEES